MDEKMQTSVSDVYAAGDICTLRDDINCGPQFFQIRLWSQARLMGEFAAHCMADSQEADLLDLGFELVSLWHTIKVFSYFKKKKKKKKNKRRRHTDSDLSFISPFFLLVYAHYPFFWKEGDLARLV